MTMLAALLLAGAALPASACTDDSAWTAPGEPFLIYGNTWYVGGCGLSSVLVTSPRGHILIDGTMAENAPLILANIRKAGFDPRDVKVILFGHAHFDHVGGVAALQAATGARVLGRAADIRALRVGHGLADDPQGASAAHYPPVPKAEAIDDKAVVRVGALALTALPNSGHTPGSTSWRWQSCEGAKCLNLVYADSLSALSAPGWRYLDHPAALAQFRASIARLGQQPCDLLITPHPSVSAMWTRFGPTATRPRAVPGQCRALAGEAAQGLETRLQEERAGKWGAAK